MGAAPLSWLAKIGGDTLKTKAKLLSSAINELYDDGFKKKDIVGSDYIKAATADDLKNKVPEANAVKELNSNLTPVKNNLAGGYPTTEIDVYKCGKEQNISATITFPIDLASANSYFTIAYAPIPPASANGATFSGTVNYANKMIPAIYRITANNDIQIFLSDEIVALGSVNVLANINVRYRIT